MIQTDYVLNEPECVPVRRGEIQAFTTFGILDQQTFRLKMKEEFIHRNLLIGGNIRTGAALLHLLQQTSQFVLQ